MTKLSSEFHPGDTSVERLRVEVFSGYVRHVGVRIQVDFEAPVGSSAIEKDAAFLAALAQHRRRLTISASANVQLHNWLRSEQYEQATGRHSSRRDSA